MKIARTLGLVFCGALLLAGPLSGQSVTGKWVFAVDLGAAGGGYATFELVQDGTEISGTYTGALGEEPVTGTIDGSTMSGTCEYGDLGAGTFAGKKEEGSGGNRPAASR